MTHKTDPPVAQEGPDWGAYYRHTLGRAPRPLFAKGIAAAAAAGISPGNAIEIGFGDGTETLALLRAGWHVLAIDPTPEAAAVLRSKVPPVDSDRLTIRTAGAEADALPPFDLLYSGYSLSFLNPGGFDPFWAGMREALRPGGLLVLNLFGVRDTWADNPRMTFVTREDVDRLLAGLDVLAIEEEDQDGDAFSGPKHWHVFDLIARRPKTGPR
jgi:SAM-dependent methyltransferase